MLLYVINYYYLVYLAQKVPAYDSKCLDMSSFGAMGISKKWKQKPPALCRWFSAPTGECDRMEYWFLLQNITGKQDGLDGNRTTHFLVKIIGGQCDS